MVYAIQNKERVEIKPEMFDCWKDGSAWKVKLPHGIETRRTKRDVYSLSASYQCILNK